MTLVELISPELVATEVHDFKEKVIDTGLLEMIEPEFEAATAQDFKEKQLGTEYLLRPYKKNSIVKSVEWYIQNDFLRQIIKDS